MNWEQLKNEGYYIRTQNGEFNNKKHTSHAICKDETETSKSIICYVNNAAKKILVEKFNYTQNIDSLETSWLNRCESMNFETQKIPMIIYWNK